ncbi:MAG: hypothetical protein COU40_02005 [Candidatus Moranbacteria bacterium CG10_big_fil_rev_8_21_14_0_10_35_21]|nr:MAG: hypothetical protein COU40_02005 [Candidatus Moranbacteria bacterium CG10_big_fil_rev_8_21_14_0_10_35_21]PJA88871.1 MAG: hypothetical protein CO139_00870 [Candidatus Moranbacteria bacterium CG_4_9_14_3_um_filter_36_9]
MFRLIKLIVWIVGLIVVSAFVLNYFGYEYNMDYFNQSKAKCKTNLDICTQNLIENGTKNAQCDINCVDPKLIIKKK